VQNPRVPPRDFRLRVVRVKINVRKHTVVRVPASDEGFLSRQRELGSDRVAALNFQRRMNASAFQLFILAQDFIGFFYYLDD